MYPKKLTRKQGSEELKPYLCASHRWMLCGWSLSICTREAAIIRRFIDRFRAKVYVHLFSISIFGPHPLGFVWEETGSWASPTDVTYCRRTAELYHRKHRSPFTSHSGTPLWSTDISHYSFIMGAQKMLRDLRLEAKLGFDIAVYIGSWMRRLCFWCLTTTSRKPSLACRRRPNDRGLNASR